MKKFFAIVSMLIASIYVQDCNASEIEKKLIKNILNGYNSIVRPTSNRSDIINVNFKVTLQQIVDLDEKNQLLTTSMYMDWSWFDAHLTWDPIDYEGINEVILPAKRVWKPDILVYNSAVDSFDQLLHTNVVVRHTGKIEWLPPGLFKTTCNVDITYFPFDEQKCKIKFGTWTYHGGMVNLTMVGGGADLSIYKKSGEWKLISMTGLQTSAKYDCCPFPFVDITFTIHIKRRTLFYGFNLMLPCILVSSLTILIFLLPADSGERITLGITVLLALVVFLQLVSDALPPTSSICLLSITVLLSLTVFLLLVAEIIPPTSLTTPLISKYFACSIIMVTISVVATVISLNFHYATSVPRKMPGWVRWIFLDKLPRLLQMESRESQTAVPQYGGDNKGDAEIPLVAMGDRLQNQWGNGVQDTELTPGMRAVEREVQSVLREIKFITGKMHEDEEDDKIALDWKYAAAVLDRFSIWFFSLFFIFSTLFTIAMAPGIFIPSAEA